MDRTLTLASLAAALLAASCGEDDGAVDFETPDEALFAVNAAFDFSSGSYSVVDIESRAVLPDVLPVAPDAVASCEGGRPWVIERFGWDTLTVISPESPFSVVAQHSVGSGANPQSMVLLEDDDALISLLDRDYLLVLDTATGEESARIDLAWAADDDGLPEAGGMGRAGDLVAVGLQRLDRSTSLWDPSGPGWLALVDPATLDVVDVDPTTPEPDAVVLDGANPAPYAKLWWDGDRLWVPTVGKYRELDGGIEKVDVASGASEGMVVREEDLGGDINDFVVTAQHTAYATVGTPGSTDELVRFDPATGEVDPEPLAVGAGFTLLELRLTRDGLVVMVDRDLSHPGIRILDPETGETLEHLSVGMHPYSICLF